MKAKRGNDSRGRLRVPSADHGMLEFKCVSDVRLGRVHQYQTDARSALEPAPLPSCNLREVHKCWSMVPLSDGCAAFLPDISLHPAKRRCSTRMGSSSVCFVIRSCHSILGIRMSLNCFTHVCFLACSSAARAGKQCLLRTRSLKQNKHLLAELLQFMKFCLASIHATLTKVERTQREVG